MSTALIRTNSSQELAPDHSQADNDAQLIALWITNKSENSPNTRTVYERNLGRFLAFIGDSPLGSVKLGDIQAFAESLKQPEPDRNGEPQTLSVGTQRQVLATVKSLFTFAVEVGYLRFNPGKPVKLPPKKNTLAERILDEQTVSEILALEPNPRNKLLLRLAYVSAGRVSEIVSLKWRDCQKRQEGGQVTLYGKGGKTRTILIPSKLWNDLEKIRGDAAQPVFESQKKNSARGGHLSTVQAWRIVKAAAKRAGVEAPVSPHWLRHAHASHALDRGAKITLVQQDLGHSNISTTREYLHVRPDESSSSYLAIG